VARRCEGDPDVLETEVAGVRPSPRRDQQTLCAERPLGAALPDVHYDTIVITFYCYRGRTRVYRNVLCLECLTENVGYLRFLARQQMWSALHQRDLHTESREGLTEFYPHRSPSQHNHRSGQGFELHDTRTVKRVDAFNPGDWWQRR
jgi:hypothetical protein